MKDKIKITRTTQVSLDGKKFLENPKPKKFKVKKQVMEKKSKSWKLSGNIHKKRFFEGRKL